MPSASGPISSAGAIIRVRVGVHSSRAERLASAGLGIPEPASVSALLDTGASLSGVDPALFTELGYDGPLDTKEIITSGGITEASFHIVNLTILGDAPRTFPSLEVFGTDFEDHEGVRCLIGRDILDKCRLVYDGPGEVFTLSF